MESLASGITTLSSFEMALLLVALQYAVVAPAWACAALVLPSDRRVAGWWALYAGASGLGLLLIVMGMHQAHALQRAIGNVLVLSAMFALQRGLWSFTGQASWPWAQAGMLVPIVALSTLAALHPAWVPVRIGALSALWAGLYLWAAWDVWCHVRNGMHQRWGALYAAPMVLGALLLAVRAVRAVHSPELVTLEVVQNTVLSVGSSLIGLVAALVLQMMLVSLLMSRLVGRLARLSRHDALTGLLNRRAIDELLRQEEQRVRRFSSLAGATLAVLMIDVDHFKRLNDSRGHAAGDRALQHLAAVMGGQLRDIDHLGRWGGEEFLALLPATTGAEAVVLAERLCERVRSASLICDGLPLTLTTSVGVAEWQGPRDSLEALLGRADVALYAAKNEGRDRVWRGAPPPLVAVLAA